MSAPKNMLPRVFYSMTEGTLVHSEERGTCVMLLDVDGRSPIVCGNENCRVNVDAKNYGKLPSWTNGMFFTYVPNTIETISRLATREEAWEFKRRYPDAEVVMPPPLKSRKYGALGPDKEPLFRNEFCAECGFVFGRHFGQNCYNSTGGFLRSRFAHSGVFEEDPPWIKDLAIAKKLRPIAQAKEKPVESISDWWDSL